MEELLPAPSDSRVVQVNEHVSARPLCLLIYCAEVPFNRLIDGLATLCR